MGNITRRNLIINTISYIFFSIFRFSFADNIKINIMAIRFWPSNSYTRLTLESNLQLKYNYFYLEDPLRLVIDLENVQLNNIIRDLPNIIDDNQFIDKVRVGKFNENILRIVIHLKNKVNLQIFTLTPFADYKDRLVVDFYPEKLSDNFDNTDPLMALLDDHIPDNNINIIKDNKEDDILDRKIQEIMNKKNINNAEKELPINISKNHDYKKYNKIKNKRKIIITIDPGHGGEDPGAIGKVGLKEKNVVLNISRLLKKKLIANGYKVYMTRDEDIFVPLNIRVAKSRKVKSDIFVSIHADAFTNRSVRGSGVFALSSRGATSNAAKYLAKTQNDSDLIGGVKKSNNPINNILFDLTQTATINSSLILGKIMLSELNKVNKLHKNYVDQAGFVVLTAPDVPSILIETAFISNITEEKLLSTGKFREKVATAIVNGLNSYIIKNIKV